jgi:GT2 family glycosyltransferase
MYQADNDLRRYFDTNPGRLLHKWLHYFEIYDHHFSRYRDKPVNILKIGIYHGGPLQLWKNYFGPQARIYAIDVDPRCKQFEEENVRIIIGDQADRSFLRKLKAEIPHPDILIDDGGHLMHQQITTFEELYPFVAEDGVYLCEDLHTSYWPDWGGGLHRQDTFVEYTKRLIDSLNAYHSQEPARFLPDQVTRSAHSLHFYDSVFVIEKRPRNSPPLDAQSGEPCFEKDGGPQSTPLHMVKSGLVLPKAQPDLTSLLPQQKFVWAVLTPYNMGAPQVEERLFQALDSDSLKHELIYGGWIESGLFRYFDDQIHEANGYILHDSFPCPQTADVLDYVFKSGKPVIYFFDKAMPELATSELSTKSGFRKFIIESLRLSNLVVVESEAQKTTYQGLNSNIVVLSQKLDASVYKTVTPPQQEPIKLAIRADEGHLEDLLLISDALKQVADRHSGEIEFHIFGLGLNALGKHPAFHFHPLVQDQEDWKEQIACIKPALALMPLRDSPGHELNSILPLLEYAACGIPVIASDIPPYRTWIKHGITGLLTANTPASWSAMIEECISNPGLLFAMGSEARQHVESERVLATGNISLANILDLAINKATKAIPAKSPVDFMHLGEKTIYQKWLSTQRLMPRDVRWMEVEMQHWDPGHRIHLLMTLLPGHAQWLARTLDSLVTQINPHWHLSIVAFTPQPADLDLDNRIHWHEVTDDEDSYDALNRLAQNTNFHWVGFIEAGDLLPPQAFFKLAFHARRKPEWRVIYTDEDQISADHNRSNPLFKPDYNPDYLHAYHYTGGLCLFDRDLFSANGGVNGEKDGAEIYDLLLRFTEQVAPVAIGHLPEILYTRFNQGGHSMRSWEEINQSSEQSLRDHLVRRDIAAEVKPGPQFGTRTVVYPLHRTPFVSILIPTRDHLELIKSCIDSLLEKTEYQNYEVLILNNDSQDLEVIDYFEAIRSHPKIRILDYPYPFNFSAICNFGANQAKGELLVLLNNDTEIIEGQWLGEMVRHGLREEVGVVGARLLFPDGKLQHAGVVIGMKAIADHPFLGNTQDQPGYMMRAQLTQNYSAVTAACLLIKADLYRSVNGMDEQDLKVLFNDVDLCLKARKAGFLVVWTPAATLIHKASISIKKQWSHQRHKTMKRVEHEHHTMFSRWLDWMADDPAYNRNLSLKTQRVDLEEDHAQGWDPGFFPAPRILAYPADVHGCGEYRITAPCRALYNAGLAQTHTSHKLCWPNEIARIKPDVIVLQRAVENLHFYAVKDMKAYLKAFRVFELDDLMHSLPRKSKHLDVIHGDEFERVLEGISLCDRFVTTTPVLADIYGRYCKDTKIVPNYLERATWGQLRPARLQGRKPRVGWAGGASHTGDLELLYPVIKALYQEVDWVFFGMCPESIRPYIHEFHPPVPLESYPSKLASLNLDLALAPLEYHPFNEAKSPLRILEYGVLGYPVICTDIVTYRGGFPVTQVNNNPQEWIDAIKHAITDRDALVAQGDALRAHVQKNWMLEDNLDKWLDAWLP